MKNKVLKGGISNSVYIWHSSVGACKKCMELDGETFYNKEDIPSKPHPNCKCYVEEIYEDNSLCDCAELYEELKNIIENMNILESVVNSEVSGLNNDVKSVESLMSDIENDILLLLPEYGKQLPDCENFIDNDVEQLYSEKFELQILMNDILGLLAPVQTILGSINSFVSNYISLLLERDGTMDKFYHSKANCEAAQRGILGEAVAVGLSDLKEFYDSYTYVHTHHVSVEERIADSERDQEANREGRLRGRNNPSCSCEVLMWDLRPKHRKYY